MEATDITRSFFANDRRYKDADTQDPFYTNLKMPVFWSVFFVCLFVFCLRFFFFLGGGFFFVSIWVELTLLIPEYRLMKTDAAIQLSDFLSVFKFRRMISYQWCNQFCLYSLKQYKMQSCNRIFPFDINLQITACVTCGIQYAPDLF